VGIVVGLSNIEIYLDGELDASFDGTFVGNSYQIGIGKSPSSFKKSTGAELWIEDMKWFHSDAVSSEMIEQLKASEPTQLSVTRRIASNVKTKIRAILEATVKVLAAESVDSALRERYLTFLSKLSSEHGPEVFEGMDRAEVTGLVIMLLAMFESASAEKQLAAWSMAMLSSVPCIRVCLIMRDAVRTLLALVDRETLFWSEIALSHLYLTGT
jgi:hypothetical protein